MNYMLTNAGIEWMAQVNAGNYKLHLTRVESGTGYSSAPYALTAVIGKKQNIQLDAVEVEEENAIIQCTLTNLELYSGYILKQIGIYAYDYANSEEILFIIGQDSKGDTIPAITEFEVEYLYSIAMKVSNTSDITFDYDVNDFLRKKYFYEHVYDYNNPHRVTKAQVGLGLVPNVTTNDQTPTWERAAVRELPISGETLSVIMGKIEKYFADLRAMAFKDEVAFTDLTAGFQKGLLEYSPYVLMNVLSYLPTYKRTYNKYYEFETLNRNVQVIYMYGDILMIPDLIETADRTDGFLYEKETTALVENAESDEGIYIMVHYGVVYTDPLGSEERTDATVEYLTETLVKGTED